jgi:peptide/nickel transport system ATP-binding protein
VADIADHVAVLQRGKLVEQGSATQVLKNAQHPYTQALLAAVPSLVPPVRAARDSAPIALSAIGLTKTYTTRGGLFGKPRVVDAVKQVAFEVRRGETLGLVGESGSGKSTTARLAIRLIEPDRGTVRLGALDYTALGPRALRDERRRIQMIFQDPFASLNPRRTVEQIITAGPIAHGTPAREARARARDLLDLVGLSPSAAERYPNAFSGGQRQRIGIARALAMEPDVLVADEAVSALDVSVQAQVLDLLEDLKQRLNLAMLFITHDLRVAAKICDRIAVMHRGAIVEMRPTAALFRAPEHAYTRDLLGAVPGLLAGQA